MEEITLEKVDKVKERMDVSYEEAKDALQKCNGDVLEAIIFIEKNNVKEECKFKENIKDTISLDELKSSIKELIDKGNVTRIKIRKDDKEIADIPVNAGVAGAVIGVIIPQILAIGVIAAIASKITIEITKEDGSTEIVNKYVSKVATDVKEKANDIADRVKNKVNDVKEEKKNSKEDHKVYNGGETIYTYTVNFDDNEIKK